MESFLSSVARLILREHPSDADRTLVVFNNHRSELFLRRAFESLSLEDQSTFFLPQTTVIDSFVASLGHLDIVPNEFLLFELYRIHVEIGGPDRKYTSFEEFISFGDTMIADFSEIDRYCVDARDLFVNLHDLKAIGEWDIENPTMSPFQRQYLQFYHSLFDYYTLLRQRLLAKGKAYGGMAYRHVAEHIATLADQVPYSKIYFVGFNALSECERRIIGEFVRRGAGHLLTDADTYYFSDPVQEAGHFLRLHCNEFPEVAPQGPSLFAQGKKKITIVQCPETVLQCKYAGRLLSDHPEWLADPESSAVVLADEKLLIPMLNSLPDADSSYKVNITMGFPFAGSAVHALSLRILSLFRHATSQGYYHSDIVDLLSDRLVERLIGQRNMRQLTVRFLERENRIRCLASDLSPLPGFSTIAYLLPDSQPSPDDALALFHRLAGQLAESTIMESNKKEKQALAAFIEILSFLRNLQSDYHYITDLSTLEKIYLRVAQRHNIAFLGQPLSGLQILGMLETRNLDFQRVILLSTNEGVLPAARSQNTLIPYELQRAFHLPTYEDKDSVYAYNFYRLIQRADEIYLLFSSESESMGKGEESRFIKQVRSELQTRFPDHIEVHDQVVAASTTLSRFHTDIPHPHSPAVADRLRKIASDGFSPSALGYYLDCPLCYYYAKLLGVQKPDTLDEDLDASQFGTAVHRALQLVYTPCIGHSVAESVLTHALDNIPDLLQEAFGQLHSHGRSQEGLNHFLISVAESQVRHLLQKELHLVRQGKAIEIIALEEEMRLCISSPDIPCPAYLTGTADRIDRIDGHLRIIDYKTGSFDRKEISASNADIESAQVPNKWFQLMCYALLYCRNHHLSEPFSSYIYPLRHLHADATPASWENDIMLFPHHVDRFEQLVTDILATILDPENNFDATPSPKGCRFCPAKSFCPQAKK